MTKPAWIAVDWGTSRLRAWAMSREGAVLGEACSDDGMGSLARDGFEPALLALIAPWLGGETVPVLACGMVGARQGWHEVPYLPVPQMPQSLKPVAVPGTDPRISLSILPGLSQAQPPDVMRGEETQVAGFLAEMSDFDGVLCLPGTHTKWVRLSAGEIVSFQTAMTGEMYHLIASHSVIRHVVQGEGVLEAEDFSAAVDDMLSMPERLTQLLFEIRASAVLRDLSPMRARSRLSGLLIGAELAATKPFWLGQDVALAANGLMEQSYRMALAKLGVQPAVYDPSALSRKGLTAAYNRMMERVA